VPISINQIAVGMALKVNGDICLVTQSKHMKPGKGGAFAKVRLKNVKTQQITERTLREADKIDVVPLEEKKLQYLYSSEDAFHFMDNETYEEAVIPRRIIGDGVKFLQDNLEVIGIFSEHDVLQIVLPTFIKAKITQTDPGLKGDSSKAGTKPATIDTGTTLQVPLFINTDDWVKIDTRSGEYVERVQK